MGWQNRVNGIKKGKYCFGCCGVKHVRRTPLLRMASTNPTTLVILHMYAVSANFNPCVFVLIHKVYHLHNLPIVLFQYLTPDLLFCPLKLVQTPLCLGTDTRQAPPPRASQVQLQISSMPHQFVQGCSKATVHQPLHQLSRSFLSSPALGTI